MPFPIYYMLPFSARVENDYLFKRKILKNKLYIKKHWRSLSGEGKKEY